MFKKITMLSVLALMFGCISSSNVNYYSLNNPTKGDSPQIRNDVAAVILLQGITFPNYLQSKYIAVKSSENQFKLSDVNNWVEPFDIMTRNYITERFNRCLPKSLLISTTRYTKPDIKVKINLVSFEKSNVNGEVGLTARWWISDGKTNVFLKHGLFSEVVKPADNSYEASAAAHSVLLNKLADEITSNL